MRLYDILNHVDSTHQIFLEDYEHIQESVDRFNDFYDVSQELILLSECPEYPIKELKKVELDNFVREHPKNKTLINALEGNQTILERLIELEEKGDWNKWKGLLRYTPRRKDNSYNLQVSELDELIHVGHLYKRGLISPNNLLARWAGFGTAITLGASLTASLQNREFIDLPYFGGYALFGFSVSTIIGFVDSTKMVFDNSRNYANKLDEELADILTE